jgi:hypothetical protein
VGTRCSAPVQTGPGAHPAPCTMGTGSFPWVKSVRGVTLTPHLLLWPRSRKIRAIPLLPFWAILPVQSLSVCTRVHLNALKHVGVLTILKNIILIYIKRYATLRSLFYLETALHVSGGTSTHHQEHKQLYLQHLVFVTPLLLPASDSSR